MIRLDTALRFSRRLLRHGLPWSVAACYSRYGHCFLPHMTAPKLANLVRAHLEMILGRADVRSTPYMLRIEPTNVCNLRCPGCATGLGLNPRPKGFLNPANLAGVLNQVKKHLLLTRLEGLGEPFLNPDIIELIGLCHTAGSATALSSHFGAATAKFARATDIVKAGLDHLIVSIDGPTQEIYEQYRVGGALDTVIDHVRELVAAKRALRSATPHIEVQFIGFRHNRHTIDQMSALVRSMGADRLTCKLVREDVLRERSAQEGAGRRCFWLYTTWTIGWDGSRKLCSNSITDDFDLPNAFAPTTDLMADHVLLAEVRRFLASRMRDIRSLHPLLGDPKSQSMPWRTPRGPDLCRCLACGGVGLVVDRTRKWLDEYVCM